MADLIDCLHDLDFKVGLYSSAADYTCKDKTKSCKPTNISGSFDTKNVTNPGSLGYEQQDADFFVELGIDYLDYGEG